MRLPERKRARTHFRRSIDTTLSYYPFSILNSASSGARQVAAQFARAGHRVFWIRSLPAAPSLFAQNGMNPLPLRENAFGRSRLRATPFDLYRGALRALPNHRHARRSEPAVQGDFGVPSSCAFLQFPFWRRIGLGLREQFGAKLVYDCMDDWQNWPADPLPGAFSLAEERELVHESDVLVVSGASF